MEYVIITLIGIGITAVILFVAHVIETARRIGCG